MATAIDITPETTVFYWEERLVAEVERTAKKAMRGFDDLPTAVRAALNEEPTVSISLARQLVKRMGAERAAQHISAKSSLRLKMQQALTRPLIVGGRV